MSAEQFHQILKSGRERGRRILVQSASLSTKLQRPLSLSLSEYHSYIKMDSPIGISGKSCI